MSLVATVVVNHTSLFTMYHIIPHIISLSYHASSEFYTELEFPAERDKQSWLTDYVLWIVESLSDENLQTGNYQSHDEAVHHQTLSSYPRDHHLKREKDNRDYIE